MSDALVAVVGSDATIVNDAVHAMIAELLDGTESNMILVHRDPDARIEELPVGVQQRVEIIKALVGDAQVLILDEPTLGLSPRLRSEFGVAIQMR